MATFAIGDVHGRFDALDDLVAQVVGLAGSADVIVFLGDYIDRGPDSRQCVDLILDLPASTAAQIVCLKGNHEDWLMSTREDFSRHSWLLGMDGLTTVHSYSAAAAASLRDAVRQNAPQLYLERCALPYEQFFDAMPSSHQAFFSGLALSLVLDGCLFAHGGVNAAVAESAEQLPDWLIWGHGRFPDDYLGTRVVVYGHHDNADVDAAGWPRPRIIGNTIGIDTISHGVLTAIRMPDRLVLQSRQYA